MAGYDALFGFDTTQKQTLVNYVADAVAGGGGGDITASQITDSTAVGRSVLTAANAAAALTAVGGLSPTGNGSGLTALNGTQITSGTIPPARIANATTGAKGLVSQAAAQANSTATDVAGLVTDFNALLAKLRTAGVLAP